MEACDICLFGESFAARPGLQVPLFCMFYSWIQLLVCAPVALLAAAAYIGISSSFLGVRAKPALHDLGVEK